jgi:hypothetical protein
MDFTKLKQIEHAECLKNGYLSWQEFIEFYFGKESILT